MNAFRRGRSVLVAAAMVSGASGCATAPEMPKPVPPEATLGAFVGATAAPVSSSPPPARWWRLFEDPVLDQHVQRALAANTDLRVAVANLDSARATARQASAARLPATVIESGVGPERADRQPSTSSVPKTSYELGITASYEIDLFGRVGNSARAARADAEASEALRDAARLAVVGDTVAAYVDLCAAVGNARLASSLIETQRGAYELIATQLRSGEVSPLELNQSRVLLDRLQATVPLYESDRRRSLIRLAILQGVPAGAATELASDCEGPPVIRVPLPVGDGANLLARRPDLREAEHRIVAATARMQVARSELYPRVQLGGSAGLIAGGSDAILTPLITWVFPNQSASRARIEAARGGAQAALAGWDRVMLRALAEVESSLAEFQAEHERQQSLASAAAESDLAASRARVRVRLGADSPLLVLDSDRARIDAAGQLLASRARLAQIQVSLFRALGGGWEQTAD